MKAPAIKLYLLLFEWGIISSSLSIRFMSTTGQISLCVDGRVVFSVSEDSRLNEIALVDGEQEHPPVAYA